MVCEWTALFGQVVGTHALLSEPVHFAQLGVAVVDEQHRFGVAQRAKLQNKNTPAPHVLAMTVRWVFDSDCERHLPTKRPWATSVEHLRLWPVALPSISCRLPVCW